MRVLLINKKIIFFILLIFSYIFFISFFWHQIKLPFFNTDNVVGLLMTKEINSNDDTFKFFLLIGPTFIAIFLYIRANFFQKFINISDFYKKKVLERKHFHLKNLLYVKLLFFLYILLEFFSLDLSRINYMDTFHDGDYLTPLINHLYYKTFWSSSYTIHGGREIFIPILGYKIFGTINFGIIKFTYNYILIFFVKFFSIILSYQILKFTSLNNKFKFLIFFISTFFLLSLSSYTEVGAFSARDLFVIIFFILFLEIFLGKNNFFLNYLLSLIVFISVLFHYDTGLYITLIYFFYILYLFIIRKFQILFVILLSIFINSFFIFIFLGSTEIVNFFSQMLHLVKNIDKIHGIEYPQPFFSMGNTPDGSRGTKLILFFLILNFFICFSIFLKNKFLNIKEKFLILFMYLYSLISFKNALGRSDGAHMVVSSDWVSILLFYFFIFTLFFFIKLNFYKFFDQKKILKILSFLLVFIIFYNFHDYKKMYEFNKKIKELTYRSSLDYIDKKRNIILKELSALIKDDLCIQNFTTDLSLPYLLKKPTCNKFFASWFVSGSEIEKEYIYQLEINKPNHIIYSSKGLIVDNLSTKDRLKIVNEYILQNYHQVFNLEGYVVMKKK